MLSENFVEITSSYLFNQLLNLSVSEIDINHIFQLQNENSSIILELVS